MYLKNGNQTDLQAALDAVNELYENNIEFKRIEPNGRRVLFTLRVKSGLNPGHRLGFHFNNDGSRRKLASACWHVHGDFFEALFEVNPECEVTSSIGTITKDYGNWQDKQVGSMMYPVMFSELCDCE